MFEKNDTSSSRLDIIEKFLKELSDEFEKVKNSVKGFESKNVDEELKKVYDKVNIRYGDLEKKIDGTHHLRDHVSRLEQDINKHKEVALTKNDLENAVKKIQSMDERVLTLEMWHENARKEMEWEKNVRNLETRVGAIESFINEPKDNNDSLMNELNDRLTNVESRIGALERIVEDALKRQPVIVE
jgi:septation ring formation regulator EzrA